jgi:NADH-quinone oxidoreductase subunit G
VAAAPRVAPAFAPAATGAGRAVLATWPQLLDAGRLLDGDDILRQTARPAVARLSKSMAGTLGVADGEPVMVSTDRGSVTLPSVITEMPDGVVWLPTNSPGASVRRLGASSGTVVTVTREGGA